jgi:hypothetical protein
MKIDHRLTPGRYRNSAGRVRTLLNAPPMLVRYADERNPKGTLIGRGAWYAWLGIGWTRVED